VPSLTVAKILISTVSKVIHSTKNMSNYTIGSKMSSKTVLNKVLRASCGKLAPVASLGMCVYVDVFQ
jgi:hypothetical protein